MHQSHARSKVRFAQRLLDPDNLPSDDPRDIVELIMLEMKLKKEQAKEEFEQAQETSHPRSGKKRDGDEQGDDSVRESGSGSGKKRKWKQEAKAAREQRKRAKATLDPPRSIRDDDVAATTTTEGRFQPKDGKNRQARRLEQLLQSLTGKDRARVETIIKGKSPKDKIKLVLEESKKTKGSAHPTEIKKGKAPAKAGKNKA